MSQPRMRKVAASGDGVARTRGQVAEASGDSVTCTVRPNRETQRSRSKNKIPKSVRYDLENALVSLCDVWFEEIKPHLVHNNIKLHVHGSSAGGDHEPPPVPPAAPPSPPSPPAAPGCSHVDPGAAPDVRASLQLRHPTNPQHPRLQDANCASCFSTPPIVSRVPCLKLPASSRQRLLSPVPSLPTPREYTQIQSKICVEEQVTRPRTRRKKCRSQPQHQSSWRVPRLCRTNSITCPGARATGTRKVASHPPPHNDYKQLIIPRRNTVMKNKSTQTEDDLLGRCSVCCQWAAREPAPAPAPRDVRARRPHSRSPPRRATPQHKRSLTKTAEVPPLFQDDLIDIIGGVDKKLRLLYSSNKRDNYPSLLNLVPLPNDRRKKPGGSNTSPPWR